MPVVVVALIKPKPEFRDDVIAAMEQAIPLVHDEDGCELYALHADDDQLVMIERWTTREALARHGAGSPGLRVFNAATDGKLAGPTEVLRLHAIPAGDQGKGQLA